MRPYGFLGLFGRTQCAPTGFWGDLGARDAPLQVFGGLGARDAPLRVFGVIWAQAMRPYGFLGLFGRRQCAPTGFGRTRRRKTPASS
ncbi:hypothetical protein BH695_2669 [Microcystis aeruginosa PCC 7806SL]|uniref:Uncharacterized protein n=1 Tax=Microcystis aeruginosa PCC 7806SL TaxID=1903187 RepID=A0AB33BUP0_MICA7|nr:hypothetical protein BH695_2669 [Microcystis aeruginosa PCC 7806SL]